MELDGTLLRELSALGRSIYRVFDSPDVWRPVLPSVPTPVQGVLLVFDGEWSLPHRVYGGELAFGVSSHRLLDASRCPSFLEAVKNLFVIEELPAAEYCVEGEQGPVVRLIARKGAV
jgi:hypothetical protein